MTRIPSFSALPTSATMAGRPLNDMDGAGLDQSDLLERLILDIRALGVTEYDFATDPHLMQRVLTQNSGGQDILSSVQGSGPYRLRGSASGGGTDETIRQVWLSQRAGMLGDSEVRSTWFDDSGTPSPSNGSDNFQFGHVHRARENKRVVKVGVATGGSTTTLVDTGMAATAHAYAYGAASNYGAYYVQVYGGTGYNQPARRITENTTTTLTFAALTTAPAAGSLYIIYTYDVRALVWAQNVIFGSKEVVNLQRWTNSADLPQNDGSGTLLTAYLKPDGTNMAPFPWYVKSQVIGRTAEFAVWLGSDPETAYGTPGRSLSVTLPDERWDDPGYCGLNFGHMSATASDWMEYEDLKVIKL